MKTKLIISAFFFPLLSYAQVGINTSTATSTLDIVAKEPTGTSPTTDGLLIPRVDRQRAQSMTAPPTSTLIYVNSIATGDTTGNAVNIDAVGHYYFNGTVWVKLNSTASPASLENIYNTDGTLTANRTVTQGGNTLTFSGTQVNASSVAGNTVSVDAANNRLGVGTATPITKLHVNGATQLTNELNFGGNATTAGNPGLSGQVLVSGGAGVAPSWRPLGVVSGTIASVHYIQGTTALTVNQGSTSDVPGLSINITVPAGITQTLLFTVLGYAVRSPSAAGQATQGVFSLLQDNVKISSAYVSSGDGGSLVNLPSPVTFLKSAILTPGTYNFKVQFSAWSGNQTVNFVPSTFAGYNGDTEAMLSKMQVLIENN